MLTFTVTSTGDILAHLVFALGYGLLLAEAAVGWKGARRIRKMAIGFAAILLALAHGYVGWQLFQAHPQRQALIQQLEAAHRHASELVSRALGAPKGPVGPGH
jgi:hypothetical protein